MKSRTSFFNGTVFKKNLTRFAPVWMLYILCLLVGMLMMYSDSDAQAYWFASHMGELPQYMALVNLFYAPLAAMLLFGDLFNSRMCNALHAMPMRRENWFVTNVLSGLFFSIFPTAVMTALAIPLLLNSCVADAWQIALYFFLGTNLEYICFFGIAVFCAMCVGSRFAMAAVYAILNAGAAVVFWLVSTLYTPMLYGVVTPSTWAENLTPVVTMVENTYIEMESYYNLQRLYNYDMSAITTEFWLGNGWPTLAIWAAAGVAFMAVALLLYRRRNLECAGDAMAIRCLEPVFQVCAAIGGAVLAYSAFGMIFGMNSDNFRAYLLLAGGLVAGWFAGRMLIERSTQVFRQKKSWLGLAALSVAVALSLWLTHVDILGIETWAPKAEELKSVTIGFYSGHGIELTEQEDIQQILRLQQLALEDRVENPGMYPNGELLPEGETFIQPTTSDEFPEQVTATAENTSCRYASRICITFLKQDGSTARREYNIWTDEEEGAIANEYLSRWEMVSQDLLLGSDTFDMDAITDFYVPGGDVPEEYHNRETVESLLEAVKADCEARTMTQRASFHDGHFVYYQDGEELTTNSLHISIYTEKDSMGFSFYADSENVLNWLREHDLTVYEIRPGLSSNG